MKFGRSQDDVVAEALVVLSRKECIFGTFIVIVLLIAMLNY